MKVMQNLSRGGRSVDVAANLDKEVAKMRQWVLFPFQSSIFFRIFAHGGNFFSSVLIRQLNKHSRPGQRSRQKEVVGPFLISILILWQYFHFLQNVEQVFIIFEKVFFAVKFSANGRTSFPIDFNRASPTVQEFICEITSGPNPQSSTFYIYIR